MKGRSISQQNKAKQNNRKCCYLLSLLLKAMLCCAQNCKHAFITPVRALTQLHKSSGTSTTSGLYKCYHLQNVILVLHDIREYKLLQGVVVKKNNLWLIDCLTKASRCFINASRPKQITFSCFLAVCPEHIFLTEKLLYCTMKLLAVVTLHTAMCQ